MLISSSANSTGDITCYRAIPIVRGALEHLYDLSVCSHTRNIEDIIISFFWCVVYVPWELLLEIAPHLLGPPELSA